MAPPTWYNMLMPLTKHTRTTYSWILHLSIVVWPVETYSIREYPTVSYQTLATFPSLSYLHTLCYFINFCRLVVLSNSCHFLISCYLFTFYVTYASYKYTCCTHRVTQLSLYCLIVCMLSVPIHSSNSPGVFGHRTIVMWWIKAWLGDSSKN